MSLVSNFDWLYASYTVGPATFTLGRQPITFGRGSVFRTMDRVSTFALTEVDTAYKPGSDALRIDFGWQHDGGRETNLSVVAAIGELEGVEHDLEAELRASSFVLRAKHSFSDFELGLTGGFVRYDAMFGVDAVWDLAVADVYAEVVATRLTADSLTAPQVSDQRLPAISAVMGLSYKPSPTVLIKPEVFFNGFGSFYARDYFAVATSERVGIGEQTALGKLYLAATSNWEATPLTNVFSGIISNLNDPSALLTLGVRRSLADNVELIAGCYAPIGLLPDMSRLEARSEYGMYPHFFFTELKGTL